MNQRSNRPTETFTSHPESGVEFTEFVVVLSILVVVFLAVRTYLQTAAENRRDSSLNAVESTIPCEGGLSSYPDACK